MLLLKSSYYPWNKDYLSTLPNTSNYCITCYYAINHNYVGVPWTVPPDIPEANYITVPCELKGLPQLGGPEFY